VPRDRLGASDRHGHCFCANEPVREPEGVCYSVDRAVATAYEWFRDEWL
jgi:hypothetical protein